jgi:ribose transport system permease protein
MNKNSISSAETKGLGNAFLKKYVVIIAWVALFVLYSVMMPDKFFTWTTIASMLGSKAVLVLVSLAIMVPLIAGDYDMSVAATLTLSSMIVTVLNVWFQVPIGAAVAIGIAVGAGVGAANGAIVSILGVDPFIVTMGMQTLLAGIILQISNQTISGVDQALKDAVYLGKLGGVSYVFFYALIACVALFYFFEFTSAGKKVLVVGRGRNVAKLSGIKVKSVRFWCFVASGTIAGIAGVLYTGMMGGADPSSGFAYLMPAFAAVFLGSTIIYPGRFNPWGCLIAVYFLVTGTTGLSLMGVQSSIQDVFYGAALILAVVFSVLVKRAEEKREMLQAKLRLNQERMKAGEARK